MVIEKQALLYYFPLGTLPFKRGTGSHLLKLVTGVEISTRPVKRSGRPGKPTKRRRRTVAAPANSVAFLLSMFILRAYESRRVRPNGQVFPRILPVAMLGTWSSLSSSLAPLRHTLNVEGGVRLNRQIDEFSKVPPELFLPVPNPHLDIFYSHNIRKNG